eukprot:SM000040S14844  [mRNA]  locus=s40:701425:707634:+ [translate_table: standard]
MAGPAAEAGRAALAWLALLVSLAAAGPSAARPTDGYLINCGGPAFTDIFGRQWTADSNYTGGVRAVATAIDITTLTNDLQGSADPQLYATARAFSLRPIDAMNESLSAGSYNLTTDLKGQYLLRLHFAFLLYQAPAFDVRSATFAVVAGGISLFPSMNVITRLQDVGRSEIREFLLPTLGTPYILVDFQPVTRSSFVSGIELINVATVLDTAAVKGAGRHPHGDVPAKVFNGSLYGNKVTPHMLLETVHRINCGGNVVTPDLDSVGRTWAKDYGWANLGSTVFSTSNDINGTGIGPALLPQVVYQSQRAAIALSNFQLSYALRVDPGFQYLVRMHFDDIGTEEGTSNPTPSPMGDRSFDCLINYNPVLINFSPQKSAGGTFSAIYKDYIASSSRSSLLEIDLAPSLQSGLSMGPTICGVEIFKVRVISAKLLASGPPEKPQSPMMRAPVPPSVTASAPSPANLSSVWSREAQTLLAIKYLLGNPKSLNSWGANTMPCDKNPWAGVGCSGTVVTSIILPHFGLSGALPSQLANLQHLRDVWLNDNELTGTLASNFGQLKSLTTLRLHNNTLKGSIPAAFGQLTSLQELTLDSNDFSGPLPLGLLNLPSLANSGDNFSIARFLPGNAKLCIPPDAHVLVQTGLPTCEGGSNGKGGNVGIIAGIVAAVLGTLGAACLVATSIICCHCYRRKRRMERSQLLVGRMSRTRSTSSLNTHSLGIMAGKDFTLGEMRRATKDFANSCIIGSGGFGNVYRGTLPTGHVVAIKRHIQGSGQGSVQFYMELEVLSRVRHRHLVSLIGYCRERGEMILVYEFMSRGTLREHLVGDTPTPDVPLGWKKRLEICIGAAKGVDYLHRGLAPPIIHRDVKSTNILLDTDFSAKVGDFGLSHLGPQKDETHVSTAVRGSFGYVDPEYYKWLKLTDKSDVYSFGVVLLETIAGRKVIDLTLSMDTLQVNLVEWAKPHMVSGSFEAIVDPKLKGAYSPASMAKVAEVANACLQVSPAPRRWDALCELGTRHLTTFTVNDYVASHIACCTELVSMMPYLGAIRMCRGVY